MPRCAASWARSPRAAWSPRPKRRRRCPSPRTGRSASCARRRCRLERCAPCSKPCTRAIRIWRRRRRRTSAWPRGTASGRWRISCAVAATACSRSAARAARTRTASSRLPARRARRSRRGRARWRRCARSTSRASAASASRQAPPRPRTSSSASSPRLKGRAKLRLKLLHAHIVRAANFLIYCPFTPPRVAPRAGRRGPFPSRRESRRGV